MLSAVRSPRMNLQGPQYADQAFAAIHQANPHRYPLTLILGRHGQGVSLFFRTGDKLSGVVQDQLFAQYPDAAIDAVPDEALEPPPDWRCFSCALTLTPDLFPLKRYAQFEDSLNRVTADPLTSLLTALAREPKDHVRAFVEITVRPARPRRRRRAVRCLERLNTDFFRTHPRLAHLYTHLALSPRLALRVAGWIFARVAARRHTPERGDPLHTSPGRVHDREEHLQAASDKLGRLLFETQLRITVAGPPAAAEQARRKLRKIAGVFGIYHAPGLSTFHPQPITSTPRWPRPSQRHSLLLSAEELATLWHPPTLTVRAPTMTAVESREFEPPLELPTPDRTDDLAILGRTVFRGTHRRFGLRPDDLARHLLLVGKTGQGKSTLLQQLLLSDIAAGRGVGLIDPHGDLADTVLQAIPSHRTNDVLYWNASDTRFPLAFNPLACPRREMRPFVASGVLSAFKKLFGDSWGPRLEHILRNALLAVLEAPDASLVTLLRLLSDPRYRQRAVLAVGDPAVRSFWTTEFERLPPKLQAEAVAPVLNKIGHFTSSPLLRNILGQSRAKLNLRRVLDAGRVLLVNLAKGRIGEDACALLGSLLVTSIQLAAMSRADLKPEERHEFRLSIDEFQQFATDSFATILSEARKFRLALICANQYTSQISEETLAAAFGNIGTLVCFQVGAQDAEVLAAQLGSGMTEQDLMTLPRYHAYVRLLIDGMPSRPFSMRTLPPQATKTDRMRADLIRRLCREAYCRPLATVEAEIRTAFAAA